MQAQADVRARYEAALAAFVERVKADRTIIAAILYGSLAYDDVWEKSDIDFMVVTKEEKQAVKSYSLVEDGINIHCEVVPRSQFRRWTEGALQGSQWHSVRTKSTIVFSTDPTINEFYDRLRHLGARDKALQLLSVGARTPWLLAKAQKWFYVKQDYAYSALYCLYLVTQLARLDVLLHDDVPGREVVQQALGYNAQFFNRVYRDFIDQPKTAATLEPVLGQLEGYLIEKTPVIYKPILDYLAAEGEVRSTGELDLHFRKHVQQETLSGAYEWLADQNVIQKVSAPLKLTDKSRTFVDEAAYYYDGGEHE